MITCNPICILPCLLFFTLVCVLFIWDVPVHRAEYTLRNQIQTLDSQPSGPPGGAPGVCGYVGSLFLQHSTCCKWRVVHC